MTTRLRCCVGKFVYPRGSNQLMHYMGLKGFIVEDALDYTHLFLLRGLRDKAAVTTPDESLERWMATTSVKPVADVAIRLLSAQASRSPIRNVTEVYPGVGCTFEYLKYLGRSLPSGCLTLSHCGIGPAALRRKYEVLHQQEPESCSYLEESAGLAWVTRHASAADLVIYHHNQAIRDIGEPILGLDDFLKAAADGPRLLVALRVSREGDQNRITVKGHSVHLPALEQVLARCSENRAGWHSRFLPDFDQEFLLPGSRAKTGLLLACSTPEPATLPGFSPVSPS